MRRVTDIGRPAVAVALAAVTLVVIALVVAVTRSGGSPSSRPAQVVSDPLLAGGAAVVAVFTHDYRTIDVDIDHAESTLVGPASSCLRPPLETVRSRAKAVHLVETAQLKSVTLTSGTPLSATLTLSVSRHVVSTTSNTTTTVPLSIELSRTVPRTGTAGPWRISHLLGACH